jgi:hypothetical protein
LPAKVKTLENGMTVINLFERNKNIAVTFQLNVSPGLNGPKTKKQQLILIFFLFSLSGKSFRPKFHRNHVTGKVD